MTDRLVAGPLDLLAGIAAIPRRHPILARMAAFFGIVLVWMLLSVAAYATCSDVRMQILAQECADQLARQDHLHHCGSKGQRAENVAYGYDTKAKTLAQWSRSPPHAANMRLPGCRGVASARARSGRTYWVMEIAW